VASFLNIDEDDADCDSAPSQSSDIQSEIDDFLKVFFLNYRKVLENYKFKEVLENYKFKTIIGKT
jgi:hypothetical protein